MTPMSVWHGSNARREVMEAPMSSSLGAMGPLLRKLDGLLAPHDRRLSKVLKSRIERLKFDLLEDIVDPFTELSEKKDPDLTTKVWLTELRELSYDIEDSIDETIPPPVHSDAAAATRSGAANTSWRRVGTTKIDGLRIQKRRTRIDKLLKKLRVDLVWEAIDRYERYLLDDSSITTVFSAQRVGGVNTPMPCNTAEVFSSVNPKIAYRSGSSRRVPRHRRHSRRTPARQGSEVQEMYQQHDDHNCNDNHPPITWQQQQLRCSSPARYEEASNLVGMDTARTKLLNWANCEEKQDLKVAYVVGPGGIGKTTLAKELYYDLGGQFRCRAFVRASRNPNLRKLLWDILSQIKRHERPSRACTVKSLIDGIKTYLQDKRYFIVIDDLWQTTIWNIVINAFPESNNCSMILITTEMDDAGLESSGYQSGYIFKMKPLEDSDSIKLFMNIVFDSECQQSHKECEKESYEITRKSGGLPLATTTVASLARWSATQQTKLGKWSYIENFLSTTLKSSGIKEIMKEILHFCYDDLPQHLKTCLLYLSMYPEGYIISKADLLKQWIAEGFICTAQDKGKEEIAESYFNELINRRLILPKRIKYIDGVLSCTVHHMVLDMIKAKSKEANFTTVTYYPHVLPGLSTKARRLSLQLSSAKLATKTANVTMPQVRSLTFFGLFEFLPFVASLKFKLIRVLILEIWGEAKKGFSSLDLSRLCELLHLRYVKISSDVAVQLPNEIARLQHLETFVVDAKVSSVPLDIIDLPNLSEIRIRHDIKLPDGIGGIRSLHKLQYFDLAQNSEDNVQSLGQLFNLKYLHLTCSTAGCEEHLKRNLDVLSTSLGKLDHLYCLTLAPGASGARRISLEGSSIIMPSVLAVVQKLEILPQICIFSRLPESIGRLRMLRVLKISVKELLKNDINHLSDLPALVVLSLQVGVARMGKVVIQRASFPALRYFQFRSSVLSMAFRAGAMSNLQCLKLGFKAKSGKQYGRMLGGVEHLLQLKEITARIATAIGDSESDQMAAVSAFHKTIEFCSQKWNAMSEHPRFPRVRVKLADWLVHDEETAHRQEETFGLTTTNTNPVCDKLPFPVDLLPDVISFTSPLDACRCSAVCTAFHAAASRDVVWDRFIPEDYRSILSRATDPVDVDFASNKKELFTSLVEQHILIDQGYTSFCLERTTGAKSYMLAARLLDITWGNTRQYWRWIATPDSRFEEVAELLDVCWLNIVANIECKDLSPNTRYKAYLVFNLTDKSYGLDSPTQESSITIAGSISARHTVSLYPRSESLRGTIGSRPHYWLQRHLEDEDEDEELQHHWGVEEEDDVEDEDEDEELQHHWGDEEEDDVEDEDEDEELQHHWGDEEEDDVEVEDEDEELQHHWGDEEEDNVEDEDEDEELQHHWGDEEEDDENEENDGSELEEEDNMKDEDDVVCEEDEKNNKVENVEDNDDEIDEKDNEDDEKDHIEIEVQEEKEDDMKVEEVEDKDNEIEELMKDEEDDIEAEEQDSDMEEENKIHYDQYFLLEEATLGPQQRTHSSPRSSSEPLYAVEYEKEVNTRYPQARGDGWMEVDLGEFYNVNLDDGTVEIRLIEHTSLNWKSGLIIEGVEIKPYKKET